MSEVKRTVSTTDAPQALGPYSQGVIATPGRLVFTAGQVPIDPKTGKLVEGDIKVQTRQVLENIRGVLQAASADLSDVIKTTVFLRDLNDFTAMNEVYAEFFDTNPPARSAVQVARLPLDVAVEIEAIAVLS